MCTHIVFDYTYLDLSNSCESFFCIDVYGLHHAFSLQIIKFFSNKTSPKIYERASVKVCQNRVTQDTQCLIFQNIKRKIYERAFVKYVFCPFIIILTRGLLHFQMASRKRPAIDQTYQFLEPPLPDSIKDISPNDNFKPILRNLHNWTVFVEKDERELFVLRFAYQMRTKIEDK